MKIRQKRVLAYVLAMVMVLNLCAVPVKAKEGGTQDGITTSGGQNTVENAGSDENSSSNDIQSHNHDWSYIVKNNTTITATCTDSSCNYSSNGITMSLKINGESDGKVTYNGNSFSAVIEAKQNTSTIIEGDADEIKNGLGIQLTIEYQKKDASGKYQKMQGEGSNSIPTDVGDYKIVATINDATNNSVDSSNQSTEPTNYTIEKDFTIEKAKLKLDMQGWTYGDVLSEFSYPKVKYISNNEEYLENDISYSYIQKQGEAYGEDYVSIQKDEIKNLGQGTYKLKAEMTNANYEFENDTIEFTVGQAESQKITVKAGDLNWDYGNDTNESPSITFYDASDAELPVSADLYNATYTYYEKNGNKTYHETGNEGKRPKEAGNYYVEVNIQWKNSAPYTIVSTEKGEITINRKKLSLSWSHPDVTDSENKKNIFYYTGQIRSVSAEIIDKNTQIVSGDDVGITYNDNEKKDVNTSEYITTATLTNDNYCISEESSKYKWWIQYFTSESDAIISCEAGQGEADQANVIWYKGKVELQAPAGYKISQDCTNWKNSIEFSVEKKYYEKYFLMKNDGGYITKQKEIIFGIDSTKPTGSIKINSKEWTDNQNAIKKYFVKGNLNAQFSVEDAGQNGSGIKSTSYYFADTLKNDEELKNLEDKDWEKVDNSNRVKIESTKKGILYARFVDYAGNIAIIHSDLLIAYKESKLSVDDNSLSYSKGDNSEGMTFDIELNGNTINKESITVKDSNNNKCNVNPKVVADQNIAKITMSATELNNLKAGVYNVSIPYNPYGVEYDNNSCGDKPEEITLSLTINDKTTPTPTPTPTPPTPTAAPAESATPPSIIVDPGVTESPKANNVSITVSVNGKVAKPEQEYYLVANNKDSITISINATGAANYTYQWYMNDGTRIAGATSSTYKVKASKAGKNSYFCEVNGKLFDSAKIYITGYNNKLSVSKGKTITAKDIFGRNHAIKSISLIRKNQKKYLKLSKKSIKAKAYCRDIKVRINTGNAKLTVAITVVIPSPKFTVKINKARTRITFKIKNKSVAKKIGCYTIEASRKKAFSYVTTNKFILTNSNKFLKGKYSFRIRFWNTKKPVKKGKLLTKKYMYSEQVQKLKVR